MERITDDQVTRLVTFTLDRIPSPGALGGGEAGRAAGALAEVAARSAAAVRYHRHSTPDRAAQTEGIATASWNLLVAIARRWDDHPDFPTDAAVETFEFDGLSPVSAAPRYATEEQR